MAASRHRARPAPGAPPDQAPPRRTTSSDAPTGARPASFFAAETSEPSVIGWMPAAAVYFGDPDGHLIEYLAMLHEPARPDLGIVSWSQRGGRAARAS
jgi:hypothetical protein